MDKGKIAKELFLKGYNCSQAVLGAFAEDYGLDLDTAMKLSSSLGGGMSRMREVCGAVSGMFLASGLEYGYDDPKASEEKADLYKLNQELASKFKEINGSIICRELLGLDVKKDTPNPEARTNEYYQKRPCADLVEDAARVLEEYINSHKN